MTTKTPTPTLCPTSWTVLHCFCPFMPFQTQLSNCLHRKSYRGTIPALWSLPPCIPWHLHTVHWSETALCHPLDFLVSTSKAEITIFGIPNTYPRTVLRVYTYKHWLNPFLIIGTAIWQSFCFKLLFCLSSVISNGLKLGLYFFSPPKPTSVSCIK